MIRTHLKGNLIGNNHIISNLYIKNEKNFMGLFGYNEGTIKNLYLKDSYIESDKAYSGGITAFNKNGTIENCHNYANIVNNSTAGAMGGIVGYGTVGKVLNCSNYGELNGTTGFIGGIAGYEWGTTVEQCSNYGNINTQAFGVGGIIGYCQTSSISQCFNEAEIQGKISIGGITGGIYKFVNLQDCYNSGKIMNTTTSNKSYLGGISGEIALYSSDYIIKNCYNIGTLEDISELSDKETCIGAISGYYEEGKVINCYNNNINAIGKINEDKGTDNIEVKSVEDNYIKSEEMIMNLNSNNSIWKYDIFELNKGYPIFEYYYENIQKQVNIGDINNNGDIETNDLVKLLRYIYIKNTHKNNEKWDLTSKEKIASDVNRDEKIDTIDVLKIKRYIAANKNENIAQKHPEWRVFK